MIRYVGSALRLLCGLLFLLDLSAAELTKASPQIVPAGARKDSAFTELFRRSSGWIAGDGALSVPLSNDRVLWLFGDSHLDDLDHATGTMPCLFQTRNAGFIHKRNDLLNVRTLVGAGPGFRSWLKNST